MEVFITACERKRAAYRVFAQGTQEPEAAPAPPGHVSTFTFKRVDSCKSVMQTDRHET